MKWERFKSLPVITVLITSFYIYYVTIFIFIDELFGLNTSIGSINAAVFTVLYSLTTFSLSVCVLTNPGRVPSGFVPDVEGENQGFVKSRFKSLPVITVLVTPDYICVTVFVFIDELFGLYTSMGPINALVFTVLCSLTTFSLSVCVLTDPGRVPSGFVPDIEADGQGFVKSGVQQTKCDKCSAYKPPRTHHCRSCRSCILRMDHHCSWVNNCIGHRNYKAFFLLVLYATAASLYSSVAVVSSVLNKDWNLAGGISVKLFYVISGVIIIGLTLTLGTLLGWHIYLIIHNMTTIEYYEGVRAAWLAKKSGQSYRHPFDVGIYKNITLVLGPNMLKWPCPTASSHIKDGINFPTIRDT